MLDVPSKSIGATFGDIWYLVFGVVHQSAEKRRIKYSIDLEMYKEEISKELSRIPKTVESDLQIIGNALEASKYCIEKEELRKMF